MEFEIEIEEENQETKKMENVKKKVSFRKPTFQHRMEYLETVLPLQKKILEFQKQAKSGDLENPEGGMADVKKFYEARFNLLYKLHDKAVFGSPADFHKVAGSDIERVCAVIEADMGATKTEVEEGFLPNSEKQQK